MGTLKALMVLFLHFKALHCCLPAAPKPAGNQPTTVQPTEVIIPTTDRGQQNETEQETATTTFAVEHEDSHYNCKFEFYFTVDKGFHTLPGVKSDCKKANKVSAAVRFLGSHAFEVVSKDSIDMTCSMAAVFISKSGGIQLVDQAVLESIKCAMKQDNCVTKDGPQFISKCSFPYIYDGRMYQACTDRPNEKADMKDSMLWCATKTDDNLVMEEGQWGWCSSACGYCGGKDIVKNSTENSVQTTCKTQKGNACVFPFLEGTLRHEKCTSWKSKYNWCATSVNPDLTYKTWEKCDMTTCAPLEDKQARQAGLARSVAKCGYDCLINLQKKMVSNPQKPLEKLLAPTPVYWKEQLTNFSYNFVSDTAFQFISGQNGIFLDCKIGSFLNFPGEKRIHAKCSNNGVFTVTGSLSFKIWENIDNTKFGCVPCPYGYKQIVGNLVQETENTISINNGMELFYDCVNLCQEEDQCQIFEYSKELKMCFLYRTLKLYSDMDQGNLICCKEADRSKNARPNFRTRYSMLAAYEGKNQMLSVFSILHSGPLLFHTIFNEKPVITAAQAKRKPSWKQNEGVWAKEALGNEIPGSPLITPGLRDLHKRTTYIKGHMTGSRFVRNYFPSNNLANQINLATPTTRLFESTGENGGIWGKKEKEWFDLLEEFMEDANRDGYVVYYTQAIIPSTETMWHFDENGYWLDTQVAIAKKVVASFVVKDRNGEVVKDVKDRELKLQFEFLNSKILSEVQKAKTIKGPFMSAVYKEWRKSGVTVEEDMWDEAKRLLERNTQ